MFKKKNKTQSSSTTTVTKYEIKDGQAVFTKSTKTTENGKVIQKSTTSGNVPVKDLKDAVPMLPPILNTRSTYVSPYRNTNTSSSSSRVTTTTTRLPSTTRIWELPQTQTTIRYEPTTTTSLIKKWEAQPTTTTTRQQILLPPINSRPTNTAIAAPKITRPIPPKSKLKPGNVYILNHMRFNNSKNEYRVGSDKDVMELTKTFKQFNMNVTPKSDQTKRDIQSLMSRSESHSRSFYLMNESNFYFVLLFSSNARLYKTSLYCGRYLDAWVTIRHDLRQR